MSYMDYVRTFKLPHSWCPGCGIGTIMQAIVRAFDALGWKNEDIAFITGIGCSGRMSTYINTNSMHTTHGRPLAFATGVKLARPDKHVVVVSGDGDALAIGGNHFIHAARRNIDIKLVIINNSVYGMTGGQVSPTTPQMFRTQTTPYGNIEPNFDVVKLAIAAGATFVARESVTRPRNLEKVIEKSFLHKGFSVVEAISNCHINLGRRNKLKDQITMLRWINDRIIPMNVAKRKSPEEIKDKIILGVFHEDKEREEYTQLYEKLVETVRGSK